MKHAHPRSAAVTATALSIALHTALILIAGLSIFSPADPPGLIRVSLLGGGSGGDAQQQPAPAAQPAAGNAAPTSRAAGATVVAAPPKEKPAVPAKRQPVMARQKQKQAILEPPAPPAAALADPPAGSAGGASGGEAVATGSGGGSGTGLGAGRGSGTGFGSGHGGGGDLRAFCLRCPKPQYPRVARLRGWEGTVDVDVALGADGNVSSASIAASSGYDVLDAAALAAARQSRFQLSSAGALRGRIAYGFRLSAVTR
jgi:protein TonB